MQYTCIDGFDNEDNMTVSDHRYLYCSLCWTVVITYVLLPGSVLLTNTGPSGGARSGASRKGDQTGNMDSVC